MISYLDIKLTPRAFEAYWYVAAWEFWGKPVTGMAHASDISSWLYNYMYMINTVMTLFCQSACSYHAYKGNNKITELQTILQRESQNS
jgi:hypothetical protein